MPRNKYPEQTVDKILDVASALFVEKGYDKTTIQDIIDQLGGLTKGAIYHHFKNKEEILTAVSERLFQSQELMLGYLIERTDLNGFEKIKEIIRISVINNQGQRQMMKSAPDIKKSPQIFLMLFNDIQEYTVPILQRFMEEGVEDGSIQVEHPRQLAEVFLLLANIWMNPLVMPCSEEELAMKFLYFKELLDNMGLPGLFDESLLSVLQSYRADYESKHKD